MGAAAGLPVRAGAGQARLSDIAEHVRVPREILEPAFDRLAVTGYAERTRESFWLTPAAPGRWRSCARTPGVAHQRAHAVRRTAGPAGPQGGREALDRITQDVWCNAMDRRHDSGDACDRRARATPRAGHRRRCGRPPSRRGPPRRIRGNVRAPRPSEPPTTRLRPPGPPPRGPRPPQR